MLQKEFEEFSNNIKISQESSILRKKRNMFEDNFKKKFPKECEEFGLEFSGSDIEFFMQGSFRLDTTIRSKDSSVDLDLAVVVPINIFDFDNPVEIKKAAKRAIEIENVRVPKIKEPCITVQYIENGEEKLHLDFPIYAKHDNSLYLARGKEFGEKSWEKSDPKGLNEYILGKLNGNSQLRRVIRFLKEWKQVVYSGDNEKDNRPPSIALTLIAVNNYIDNLSDFEQLYNIFTVMSDSFHVEYDSEFEIAKARINCVLPTFPYSDVMTKFNNNISKGIKFYKNVKKAIKHLNDARNCDNEHEAGKCIQKILGDNFQIPEKEIKNKEYHATSEHRFG